MFNTYPDGAGFRHFQPYDDMSQGANGGIIPADGYDFASKQQGAIQEPRMDDSHNEAIEREQLGAYAEALGMPEASFTDKEVDLLYELWGNGSHAKEITGRMTRRVREAFLHPETNVPLEHTKAHFSSWLQQNPSKKHPEVGVAAYANPMAFEYLVEVYEMNAAEANTVLALLEINGFEGKGLSGLEENVDVALMLTDDGFEHADQVIEGWTEALLADGLSVDEAEQYIYGDDYQPPEDIAGQTIDPVNKLTAIEDEEQRSIVVGGRKFLSLDAILEALAEADKDITLEFEGVISQNPDIFSPEDTVVEHVEKLQKIVGKREVLRALINKIPE